jgi:flavodoxin I
MTEISRKITSHGDEIGPDPNLEIRLPSPDRNTPLERLLKSALIFGSSTGNTEYVAGLIIEALKPEITLEVIDVNTVDADDLSKMDFALCGIPTWDVGQLEQGWNEIFERLDEVTLDGLTVAMFGLGDQSTYIETYQDAMGILYRKMIERGARGEIGFTPTESHTYEGTLGTVDGSFCGLALDEDSQPELTEERIQKWAASVKQSWPSIVASVVPVTNDG